MAVAVRAQLRDRHGEYGFDGLLAGVVGMAAGGIALFVLAVLLLRAGHAGSAAFPFVGAASLLSTVGIYVHTTRRGKFAVWAELIDELRLAGDERVLDVGCGRGAVVGHGVPRDAPRNGVEAAVVTATAEPSELGGDQLHRHEREVRGLLGRAAPTVTSV